MILETLALNFKSYLEKFFFIYELLDSTASPPPKVHHISGYL